MKKRYLVILTTAAVAAIVGLGILTWRTSFESKTQKTLMEQQIALITLSLKVPGAILEGFTKADKVYIAQVNMPGSSSHLYAFIGEKWFDLGEGQITIQSDSKIK